MRVKVLGTAAGGGVPQWNCACSNCEAARTGAARRRSVAALAVSAGDDRWVLVNASCDIGAQLAAAHELQPSKRRSTPISALLLSDANVDHAAGVLEFRQADTFSIHSTALVKETLRACALFAQFDATQKQWRAFPGGARVRVDLPEAPRLDVYAIAVRGLLPSYAGGEEQDGAAVAYAFEHDGKRLLYAPIFLSFSETLRQELARSDAVLLDGTCWTDEEMIQLGLGTRTSRAMGHAPISGAHGSLQAASSTRAVHRYYTHINNTNPILDPASAQARELRDAGFAVPNDGLEIVLDGGRIQD